MAAPRDAYTRKADTLAKLRARHADIWVATAALADAQPLAHLIPLSLAWIEECVVVAAPAQQQTARNIALHGKARLVLERLIGVAEGFATSCGAGRVWRHAELSALPTAWSVLAH